MADHTQDAEATQFRRHGYLVVRKLVGPGECVALRAAVDAMLDPLQGPAEFEADTGYPGAPTDRAAPGGTTPRRLLHAYSRDPLLRALARDPRIARHLKTLFGDRVPCLSQCHHNCVMTKHPGFSSLTSWHQDIRYWSFERPELISTWVALGAERKDNGALQVIPGSHTLDIAPHRYDPTLFLRTDLAENQALIAAARTVELDAGDVLFFHCRLFHAAGRNETDTVKYSVVFTYHDADNHPTPGTRSAVYPSVALSG